MTWRFCAAGETRLKKSLYAADGRVICEREGQTARFLAPEISKFIRRQVRTGLKGCGTGMDKDEIFEADTQDGGRRTGVQQECNDPSDIRYHGKSMAWYKTQQWEALSTPMAAFDPEPIPDYGQRVEIGRDLLLDDLPAREEGKGYVSVAEDQVGRAQEDENM